MLQVVDETIEQVVQRVKVVISIGLEAVRQKVGRTIAQSDIPIVIVELFQQWARDQVPSLDITDETLDTLVLADPHLLEKLHRRITDERLHTLIDEIINSKIIQPHS